MHARLRDAHAAHDQGCGIYPILVLNAANGSKPSQILMSLFISSRSQTLMRGSRRILWRIRNATILHALSCRRQVFQDCRGAGILVCRTCCTWPVAAGGEADRGSRRAGERSSSRDAAGVRGLRDGCASGRVSGDPGRSERTHASPDPSCGRCSGTPLRSRPVRSRVAAAQEGAAARRVRTLPCCHAE
jgi:hypothetical protein